MFMRMGGLAEAESFSRMYNMLNCCMASFWCSAAEHLQVMLSAVVFILGGAVWLALERWLDKRDEPFPHPKLKGMLRGILISMAVLMVVFFVHEYNAVVKIAGCETEDGGTDDLPLGPFLPMSYSNGFGMEFILIRGEEPYYLQTGEVTNEQWSRVMAVPVSEGQSPRLPKTDVSRQDVEEFLYRLGFQARLPGELQGAVYALPTREQFVNACEVIYGAEFWKVSNKDAILERFRPNLADVTLEQESTHAVIWLENGERYEDQSAGLRESVPGPAENGMVAVVELVGNAGEMLVGGDGEEDIYVGGGGYTDFDWSAFLNRDCAKAREDYRAKDLGFRCILRIQDERSN